MWNALLVFVGGGLGSLARWGASDLVNHEFGHAFPWGTLVVNVTGCFVIGLFATVTGPDGRWMAPASFRQFFMLGICGGYTTFSSFSVETLTLASRGESLKAGTNAVLSVMLCLVGVWFGHVLASRLNSMTGRRPRAGAPSPTPEKNVNAPANTGLSCGDQSVARYHERPTL